MKLFKEKSERKSLIITTIISSILIVSLFFLGLTYMDPPEESGIAINFGSSDWGSGEVQPQQAVRTAPTEQDESQEEVQESHNTPTEASLPDLLKEEAVTQSTEDAPVVEEAKPVKDKSASVSESTKATDANEEKAPEQQEETPPKPDQSTAEALQRILDGKANDGEAGRGEGDDSRPGDKGSLDGDPNATSYYGQGQGLDGDGNYRLGGRRALNKQKYVQDCNESGTVVVEIKVNRQGEVIRATAGVRGTTNASNCLLIPARQAALDTRFNADANAPAVQTGTIIYEFRLSD